VTDVVPSRSASSRVTCSVNGDERARARVSAYNVSGSKVNAFTWPGWMGPKCRRSRVATLVTPNRAATAMTLASVPGEWPVGIQLDELGHAPVVGSGDIDRYHFADREQSQKCCLTSCCRRFSQAGSRPQHKRWLVQAAPKLRSPMTRCTPDGSDHRPRPMLREDRY
jgi:hypothetical protein